MKVSKRKSTYYVIDTDGEEEVVKEKHFRKRRGKMVRIPDEWVGQTLHPQTKRKRHSKQSRSVVCRSFHRSDKTMDTIKHKQGDYLDDEIE